MGSRRRAKNACSSVPFAVSFLYFICHDCPVVIACCRFLILHCLQHLLPLKVVSMLRLIPRSTLGLLKIVFCGYHHAATAFVFSYPDLKLLHRHGFLGVARCIRIDCKAHVFSNNNNNS